VLYKIYFLYGTGKSTADVPAYLARRAESEPPHAFPSREDRQLSAGRIFEMTRELRCADLIPGCDFVAQGTHDSDVMKKAAEHAKRAHRMIAIGMEVEKKARAAIRDVVGELAAGR
jgi:predicted small metal-binding protein